MQLHLDEIAARVTAGAPWALRQSVHAAGMSDRLPFGRMTSTSNTPCRLMLLITASVWPSNAWRLRITVT
jgi:hypothetical protein